MKKIIPKINAVIISTILFGFFSAFATFGNEPIAFTITPSLFKINLGPGENWDSGLKISNNNPASLTIYVSAVNLSDKSVPILNQDSEIYENSLANWIKFQEKTTTIL